MAFRVWKVFGTFEKLAQDLYSRRLQDFGTRKTIFSADGNRDVRNGIILNSTAKLMMLSSLVMRTGLETRGHLPE